MFIMDLLMGLLASNFAVALSDRGSVCVILKVLMEAEVQMSSWSILWPPLPPPLTDWLGNGQIHFNIGGYNSLYWWGNKYLIIKTKFIAISNIISNIEQHTSYG